MNVQITKIDSNVISSLRMPLAFLVVLWHACGYGMIADQTMSFTNGLFDTIKILFSEGICIISVPIFFVISGFLFEAHFCRCQWSFCNYKEYIIKKLARLVVPYLLWNVLFLVAFYLLRLAGDFIETGSVNYSFCEYVGENKGFQLFAYGNEGYPINYPLWFVRDLIIVNLLYPILYFLNQYSGGGILLIINLLYIVSPAVSVPRFIPLEAISFFFVGMYLKRNVKVLDVLEGRNKYWILVLSIMTACLLLVATLSYGNNNILYGISSKLFVYSFSPIVIHALYRYYEIGEKNKPMNNIASKSFFVYAVHAIILGYICAALGKFTHIDSQVLNVVIYFIVAIATFAISLFSYKILNKFSPKFISILTGGR